MVKAKATIDELRQAYRDLGSVHLVGKRFGMHGSSVHERLASADYDEWKIRHWTDDDDDRLRKEYGKFADQADLKTLAAIMGRSLAGINNRAKRLGLQERGRPKPFLIGKKPNWITNGQPHPRGMKGKKHTPEAKQRMAKIHKKRWDEMSESERDALADSRLAGRMNSETRSTESSDAKKSWKAGWHFIGKHRKYYRSRWEANYARYLEWRRARGEIQSWEHEPKVFWFEGIRRGVCSYKPDFRVVERDGTAVWHEVKGWMDARSRTTLNRMRKYFPDEIVIVIDKEKYKEIRRRFAPMVEGWE